MKKIYLLPFLILIFLFTAKSSFGEEIVITGNGESSNNEVNVSVPNNTTVSQGNNTEANNNVETTSNSGSNETESNNSSVDVNTGNSDSSTSVENKNVNINIAESNCGTDCPKPEEKIIISGNGSNSNNQISTDSQTNINVSQSNNADIVNNIETKGSSGENFVKGVKGDVEITTGNVTLKTGLKNKDINFNKLKIQIGENQVSIDLSGNGEGSSNQLIINDNREIFYESNNFANIVNNIETKGESGKNKVIAACGDVIIKTGNVIVETFVENKVNVSIAKIICEKCPPVTPPPVTPPPVTPPPGGPGGPGPSVSAGGGGGAGAGESAPGQVQGAVLPVTGGGMYWLILLTLASLIAFFLGLYLRRYSGYAPPTI